MFAAESLAPRALHVRNTSYHSDRETPVSAWFSMASVKFKKAFWRRDGGIALCLVSALERQARQKLTMKRLGASGRKEVGGVGKAGPDCGLNAHHNHGGNRCEPPCIAKGYSGKPTFLRITFTLGSP
jgi:hypothetical protein